MSWASLLKLGTIALSKASSLLKGTGKAATSLASKSPNIAKGVSEIAQTVAKPAIYITKNPKTAIIAPGIAYAGWKGLVDKQPVVQSAKEYGSTLLNAAVGQNDAAEITDDLSSAKDTVTDIKDTVTEGRGLISSLNESLGGIKNFISNITGGEGLNMFGNFFKNIFSGKVSGMSIIGLLAGGLLTFGRFGWLGKIAGALLGMTMIGNNTMSLSNNRNITENRQESLSASVSESKGLKR